MELQTKYDIGQDVIIQGLKSSGRVSKIILDGKNLMYEVYYWFDGNLRFVTLGEDDLEEKQSKKVEL